MAFEFTPLIIGFIVTVLLSVLVLMTKSRHGAYTSDLVSGPQKVHSHEVTRLGGVALFAGLLSVVIYTEASHQYFLLCIIALLPVFIFGVTEDVTKNVSPRLRLVASVTTGIMFLFAFDVHLTKTGFAFSDQLLNFVPLAMFLTVLAIAAMVNAVNIIDGLNGLSIGTSLFVMVAVFAAASQADDGEMAHFALVIAACLFAVGLFNFPQGRMFMGDGGAYIMGGIVAFSAILIAERNVDVSPFFSLLLVAYPFYELMRTMIRRIRMASADMMAPDLNHLHSRVFVHLHNRGHSAERANVLASCRVLILPAMSCLWAALFWGNSLMLIAGICAIVIAYEGLYRLHSAR